MSNNLKRHVCVFGNFALVLALLVCTHGGKNAEKQLTLKWQTGEKALTLGAMQSRFGTRTVAIDDHYLGRKVSYRALPLKAMLAAFAEEHPGFDEIVFRCADGYLAHVARRDFDAGKLDGFYLAFGEDADIFKSKILQGKAEVSPEPFYAVSTDAGGYKTLSWPYAVVAIELVNFKAMFPKLYFSGLENDSAVKEGFDLFRKECLRCHSLNLQGGDIGPELNVPKNITEYRDEIFLKSFIRNASSYRAKAKMPNFTNFGDRQLGAIVKYLRAMARHKS